MGASARASASHLETPCPNHRCCRGSGRLAPQTRCGRARDGRRLGRHRQTVARHRRRSAAQPAWPHERLLITAVDARTVNLSCSTATGGRPGGRCGRQLLECFRLPHRRQPLHRRRLPDQRRQCRPGIRIRTGPGAVAVRRQGAHPGEVGHASRIPDRRTAGTRQRSRDDLPGQRSISSFGDNRWIRPRVRRRLEPVTTRAEASPSP